MLQAIYNKSRLAAVMRSHLARLPGGSPGLALLISLTGKVKLAAPLRKNNDVVLVLGTIGPFPKPPPCPPSPHSHSPSPRRPLSPAARRLTAHHL